MDRISRESSIHPGVSRYRRQVASPRNCPLKTDKYAVRWSVITWTAVRPDDLELGHPEQEALTSPAGYNIRSFTQRLAVKAPQSVYTRIRAKATFRLEPGTWAESHLDWQKDFGYIPEVLQP